MTFYILLSIRTNLGLFVGDAVLQIQGRRLGSRGTAPFLKLGIFAHSAFQKGMEREGSGETWHIGEWQQEQ